MGCWEVIWDVEDETFGGVYSLRQSFSTREEAHEFAANLHHDALVSNIEIEGEDYDEL